MALAETPAKRRAKRSRLSVPPRLIGYAIMLLAWEMIASRLPPAVFPSLRVILRTLWEDLVLTGDLLVHVKSTMFRLSIGFVLAFILGGVIGILMGARRFWEGVFGDFVLVGVSVPGLIWAILSTMWFGLSVTGPIIAIMMVVFPFVTLNIFQGVRAVDKDLLDMSVAYGVPRLEVLRRIVIPSVMPFVFAAARYAFATAWKIVTLTEVFGAQSGIGFMIRYNYDAFRVRGVIAWSLVFTLILLVIEYALLKPMERRLFRWRPETEVK